MIEEVQNLSYTLRLQKKEVVQSHYKWLEGQPLHSNS